MAQTTSEALETQLRTDLSIDIGSPTPIQILREEHDDATYSRWYVSGSPSENEDNHRSMWVRTTVANSVANQAAEIVVAMTSDTVAVNGNVDPDAE